jgi:hypothetical protein
MLLYVHMPDPQYTIQIVRLGFHTQRHRSSPQVSHAMALRRQHQARLQRLPCDVGYILHVTFCTGMTATDLYSSLPRIRRVSRGSMP